MFKTKGGGGSTAFWTMFKKTALLVQQGFPNLDNMFFSEPFGVAILSQKFQAYNYQTRHPGFIVDGLLYLLRIEGSCSIVGGKEYVWEFSSLSGSPLVLRGVVPDQTSGCHIISIRGADANAKVARSPVCVEIKSNLLWRLFGMKDSRFLVG